MSDPFHYVITRQDLPPDLRSPMSVHAANESASGTPKLPNTTRVGVLAAQHQAELIEVAALLKNAGLDHTVIYETEGGFAGQAMSIGVNPWIPREMVRPLLVHLHRLR